MLGESHLEVQLTVAERGCLSLPAAHQPGAAMGRRRAGSTPLLPRAARGRRSAQETCSSVGTLERSSCSRFQLPRCEALGKHRPGVCTVWASSALRDATTEHRGNGKEKRGKGTWLGEREMSSGTLTQTPLLSSDVQVQLY